MPITVAAKESKVDVLVIGAGPAGLMSAFALARAGINVQIVDKRYVERLLLKIDDKFISLIKVQRKLQLDKPTAYNQEPLKFLRCFLVYVYSLSILIDPDMTRATGSPIDC